MLLLHDVADSVVALGYSTPALEGHNVDFTCPPSLILIGPNISICMGNGEWEPDPNLKRQCAMVIIIFMLR